MKILALEFSANERSVAVAEKLPQSPIRILASIRELDFRNVTGLTLIDRAISEARLQPSDITHMAIGVGPGSYAGIRSAIAIAQGWQLGRDVQLVGMSGVACLAEQTRVANIHGTVTIIIDAQRQELYATRFIIDSSCAREIEPLKIVSPDAVAGSDVIIGPEASRYFPHARNLSPSAELLARLASTEINFTPGELLEPIYLRQAIFVKAPTPRTIA